MILSFFFFLSAAPSVHVNVYELAYKGLDRPGVPVKEKFKLLDIMQTDRVRHILTIDRTK